MIAKYKGYLGNLAARLGRYRAYAWVLLATVVAAWIWRAGAFNRLEEAAFDARLHLRQDHGWPADLALVQIDDETTQEVGPWPWPRAKQKELLDKVRSYGAKTILYDVFLTAKGNPPQDDEALATSLGDVVLGVPNTPSATQSPSPSLLNAMVDLSAPLLYGLDELAMPQEVFAAHAAGIGLSPVKRSDDGRIRGITPLIGIRGLLGAVPHVSLVAFLQQRGFRPKDLRVGDDKLYLPNGVSLPLNGGASYLDYTNSDMYALAPVRGLAVLHGDRPAELKAALQGKLALVYLNTVYVKDTFDTPVKAGLPGGLLLATALRGYDHGHVPRPLSNTLCYLVVVVLGFLLGPWISRRPPLKIAEAGGIAAVVVVVATSLPAFVDLFPPVVLPLAFVTFETAFLTLDSLRSIEGERSQLAELLQLARKQGSGSSHLAVEQLAVTDRARKGQSAPAILDPEFAPTKNLATADGGEVPSDSAPSLAGPGTRASAPSAASRPSAAILLGGGQALEEDYEFGRYLVKSALGQGGMGAIFLAIDKDLQRPVALKVLSTADKAAFERFRREALAVARLSHPNVVQIYEVNLDPKAPYIVMEYVGGGTLGDILRDPDEPLPMDWKRASRIIMGAAAGLGAAHQRGIVHRDVKPANILMTQRGGDIAKVSDFGIAKLGGEERLTQEGSFVGTIGYLSPEQALGKDVDARSDVYSLALTWYRLLTGQRAFDGTTAQILRNTVSSPVPDPRQVVPTIPLPVAELLLRMGDIDKERRPKSGTVVAEAIRSMLT